MNFIDEKDFALLISAIMVIGVLSLLIGLAAHARITNLKNDLSGSKYKSGPE